MIKRYLLINHGGSQTIPAWLLLVGPILLAGQILMRRTDTAGRVCTLPLTRFAMVYGAIWAFALAMLPLGFRPFIYFQF